MSLKAFAAALLLAASLAQPALADRFVGFGRNVIVAPIAPYAAPAFYPPYAPYVPYASPYVGAAPYFYPLPLDYGANWRDDYFDATRTKVHGYTLR